MSGSSSASSTLARVAEAHALPGVGAWLSAHPHALDALWRPDEELNPRPELYRDGLLPEVGVRLADIERFVVAFSGGKDSVALVLTLLELGVPRAKMELWHHEIDGRGPRFFDWPCTLAYCQAFADAFGLPLWRSYREGGFEREMLREGTPTAPVVFEHPGGPPIRVGGHGPPGVRRRFPQTSSDLSVRWCSSALKIDVGKRALANDPRFRAGLFALLTGERAQESAARAKYAPVEWHTTSTQARRVVQWRAVHGLDAPAVWSLLRRHRVRPHPAYRLGFSRVSCMTCIFGNDDQWATIRALAPATFERIAAYEREFGATIHRKRGIVERAERGSVLYPPALDALARASQEARFDESMVMDPWELPAGASRETGGPT